MALHKTVSRVIALEEAFLHPRVWELYPESLRQKYQPVKARLSDVGTERVRLMDAAGIDMQVLSHVQPGVQLLKPSTPVPPPPTSATRGTGCGRAPNRG
jgi:hypothetical protein